jgi:hypothetical protein
MVMKEGGENGERSDLGARHESIVVPVNRSRARGGDEVPEGTNECGWSKESDRDLIDVGMAESRESADTGTHKQWMNGELASDCSSGSPEDRNLICA